MNLGVSYKLLQLIFLGGGAVSGGGDGKMSCPEMFSDQNPLPPLGTAYSKDFPSPS